MLRAQVPIQTWAEWDDAVPGFVEIDLVGHEGGNSSGEFCLTLTVTDITTGWTVNRSVRVMSPAFAEVFQRGNEASFPEVLR